MPNRQLNELSAENGQGNLKWPWQSYVPCAFAVFEMVCIVVFREYVRAFITVIVHTIRIVDTDFVDLDNMVYDKLLHIQMPIH